MLGRISRQFIRTGLHTERGLYPPAQLHEVVRKNFSALPTSPSSLSLLNKVSYPSNIKQPIPIPRRLFSSENSMDASLIARAAEKLVQDPVKGEEVLKNLPPKLHEQLAFVLLEKNPAALRPNILLFTLEKEASRIKIFTELYKCPLASDETRWKYRRFLFENFQHFAFTDKGFIEKILPKALFYKEMKESFFCNLGITDPDIKENFLLYLSQEEPTRFLSCADEMTFHLAAVRDPSTVEKILLHVAKQLPIDYTSGAKGFGVSPFGFSSLNVFAKVLPRLTTDPSIRKAVALSIAEKDPSSLLGTLDKLALDAKTRQKILQQAAKAIDPPDHIRSHSDVKHLLQEISNLQDSAFTQEIVLTIANTNPLALIGSIKSLNRSEQTLKDIITKILHATGLFDRGDAWNADDSEKTKALLRELPTLGLQDSVFVEKIVMAICDKRPMSLIGLLQPLHLSEKTAKAVITKMLYSIDFSDREHLWHATHTRRSRALLRELSSLGLQDRKFIEDIVLFLLEKSPCSLITELPPVSKDVLKTILTTLLSPEVSSSQDIRNCAESIAIDLKENFDKEDQEFIDKTALSLAQRCPFALLEYLSSLPLSQSTLQAAISAMVADPNSSFPKDYIGLSKAKTFKSLLEKLPSLHLEQAFYEKTILDISAVSIQSFEGVLASLSVKEDLLKQIIEKMAKYNFVERTLAKPAAFVKELQSLGIKDTNFVDKILVDISYGYSSELELSDFRFTNETTFASIIKNLIHNRSIISKLDTFLQEIIMHNIQDKKLISSIACSILKSFELNRYENMVDKLGKQSPKDGLPLFIHTLGLTDLSMRKEIALDVLKFIVKDDLHVYDLQTRLGSAITLLGLNEQSIFEEIVLSVLTTQEVPPITLGIFYNDPRISHWITPSFFLRRWEFAANSTKTFKPLELLTQFFQKPEIAKILSSHTENPFKTHMFGLLITLDRSKNLTFEQKLETLIDTYQAHADSLLSIEELTGNCIVSDIVSSKYDYYVLCNRIDTLLKLHIQNPTFLEKAALRISKEHPKFIAADIRRFSITNVKALEAIGVNILAHTSGGHYFERYLANLQLPKQSVLRIYTEYGALLHMEGKCTLAPAVMSEVFGQILKYRNVTLSREYLATFLEYVTNPSYQKAFGYYTLNTKPKENPIFIHKILPGVFLAKWDMDMEEADAPFRKMLSEFLGNGAIRKALRDPTQPLIQNLLFAASALDKDTSLKPHAKLKLFAQVCSLQQKGHTPSAQELADSLRTLRFLCSLFQGKELDHDFTQSTTLELSAVFQKVAIDESIIPDLRKIENIESKYTKVFVANALIPGGLSTYEAGFRALSSQGKQLIFSKGFLEDLSRFAHMCLEENSNERYRIDLHPDLKRLSETFPQVFEGWKTSLPPIELEILQQTPQDKPIKDVNFISIIEKELTEYKESPVTVRIAAHLKAFPGVSSVKEQLDLIKLIEKDLYQLDPIPMDALKSLEEAATAAGAKQKIHVRDIDHPLTIFEMPTLVCQSCQNLSADPFYNLYLIGYPLDGGVRVMAVQDTLGKFIARAILRIYFNENKEPFLLLERVYTSPKIPLEDARQAIYEGALQKALSLNIPIFASLSDSIGVTKTIHSEGRSTNYYSDVAVDAVGSHRIAGKGPHILQTVPVIEITEEKFQRPKKSS